MVDLLGKGADPNWSYKGTTVWNHTLRFALYSGKNFGTAPWRPREQSKAFSITWLHVFKTFLEHGADPAAVDSIILGKLREAKSITHREVALRVLDLIAKSKRWSLPWLRASIFGEGAPGDTTLWMGSLDVYMRKPNS
ncbi:hypothetical protein IFR04_007325 [Cadophora malorum]|uniref:Uncharacterized protein n=1 Tax=Cadophora malorum TaxID=108018 RepID=A0A8H7W6M8_9HELO|nr:hypothetical protein IFR04_007325 [Cadophora malorum]